jgi:hypothetical protein
VHVIDREADSVDHYRRWDAAGHRYLVRGDDRRVTCEGRSLLLSEVRTRLRQRGAFRSVGDVTYHDRPAGLWVAEAPVVLRRPAKKNTGGHRYQRAGRMLGLRLVVVELRDELGVVLAHWLLLSNVPKAWAVID